MATEWLEVLIPGGLILLAGGGLLFALVKELEPAQRRKWLLGVALGGGMLSFASKILLITVFSVSPESLVNLFPKRALEYATPTAEAALSATEIRVSGPSGWEVLPEVPPVPIDNPMTSEKVELGKRLFFDKRLSYDDTVACVSCHELSPEKAGGDALATSLGIEQQKGTRNAPSVINAAYQRVLFWDGRASSLEEQALGPLINPVEMGMPSLSFVEEKVNAIPEYVEAFQRVFSDDSMVTADAIAKAIAAYERTLVTPDSAYDRFVHGDKEALTAQQLRGMELFRSHGCRSCHSGPNFSSASVLENTAAFRIFPSMPDDSLEQRYRLSEDGGLSVLKRGDQGGVWRVPPLRNVARTGPYFHNGSVETLEEAVRIMAKVQLGKSLSNDAQDDRQVYWLEAEQRFSALQDRALSDAEVNDIVAFLEALNGDLPEEVALAPL